MFEVIISHIHTGRVQRGFFATREEAQRYLAGRQEKLAEQNRSLSQFRMEIHHRPSAVLLAHPATPATPAAA